MSETQIIDQSINMDQTEKPIIENTKAVQPDVVDVDADADADLEDGEIDDDDDDDEDVIITAVANNINELSSSHTQKLNERPKVAKDDVVTIDLLDDSGQPPSPISKSIKSKKQKPLEDDHYSSIEHALANALKKKGIDPVLPILETRNGLDEETAIQQGSSRSNRRRKRKKQREEKEKQKGGSEKKKSRYDSPDSTKSKPIEIEDDDDLMEDYEMLNVRGGSPPPISHVSHPIMPSYKDQYDSGDDSNYSYESYDSGNDGDSPSESRRKRRHKKDKESRKRRGRNRNDGERQDKSNRRGDSPDRQEPRKLELCKFYLMECCAKRDKCSYMHADFPCKYYYLGMDCTLKDDCKFAHGEPLSEQLRNILLKHLETAPKEILGNFKRISREQAIVQMNKRHEELCQKFNVQNTWSHFPNLSMNHNRRGVNNEQQQYHNQQQHQQNTQQQQQQQGQQQNMHNNIPSLLDLDIRPPIGEFMDLNKNTNGGGNAIAQDKQRKSRWCDSRSNLEPPPNNAPSYLDLKNLTGILSEEHIKQLSDIGIVNLEQVNQLTVGQLNELGLTIAEINEIQLNAKNMAKLGVPIGGNIKLNPVDIGANTIITEKTSPKTDKSPTSQNNSEKLNDKTTSSFTKTLPDESTNSNSNSNSGVIMVDYSQYLKDSNLPFERGDDDERDDEQLIIDDGNTDNEESPFGTTSKSGNDSKKRKDSFSDSEQQQQQHQLPLQPTLHKLQMPNFTNALRNPFSSIPAFNKQLQQDPRFSSQQQNESELDVFKPSQDELLLFKKKSTGNDTDSDDERYYASRGRRSRSVTPTRSGGSSTPEGSPSPPAVDFSRAPKLRVNPKYERTTMYDYDVERANEEDAAHAAKSRKADKDMRLKEGTSVGSGDIDLRLPFLPVTNYTPATEIDCSLTSHLPMTYKVYEIDIKHPNYVELRQNFKSEQTCDPRLRRILGLPETPTTRTTVELSRSVRKLSNTIASPESSDGASPKYYTPSMSSANSATEERLRRNNQKRTSEHAATATAPAVPAATPQLRVDPRRAARQAAESARTASTAQNGPPVMSTVPQNANKQNLEIRNYLNNSDWYKNLNSKFKIMVNQQLALVSTELKKFHQDPSPTKIFDISFIVNNTTLQQILTNLGIYIDDNGEVSHIDGDADEAEQASQDANSQTGSNNSNIVLPNLSQPPPTQPQPQPQLDFLRAPPPHMFGQGINMQPFTAPPPNTRPSLLGLPPGAPRNPFNPFSGNVQVPFVGGPPSLLGPGPGTVPAMNPPPLGFGNFGMPPNVQQKRNFANARNNNQQRNPRQRRNTFNAARGNI